MEYPEAEPYFSENAKIYHISSECSIGKKIKSVDKISGSTKDRTLCLQCLDIIYLARHDILSNPIADQNEDVMGFTNLGDSQQSYMLEKPPPPPPKKEPDPKPTEVKEDKNKGKKK